jgi:hypothetical protein
MEHLVRVLNDHDRRVLAWLRQQVGDMAFADAAGRCGPVKPYISTVCRQLGLTVPVLRAAVHAPTATGERSLAHIRRILAERGANPQTLRRGHQASLTSFNR